MPNIEIHGLDSKEANKLCFLARRALDSVGLLERSGIEIFDTLTRAGKGMGSLPYLQIVTTREEATNQISRIKKALRKEGVTLPLQILLIEEFDEGE